MISALQLINVLVILPFVVAVPTPEIEKRATTFCGQWDTFTDGNFELFLDQWGLSDATSGSDCASITSVSGNTVAWTTTYDWVGGTGIKSFTNIQLNAGINQQLSAISSIPSTWDWTISTSGTIVADVAYDIFTSDTSGGSATNEIMIWLANFNAGPISSSYNADGQPNPIASDISIAGQSWNLYSGSNGANAVWSFLPSTSGATITSFSGDINLFFNYLTTNEGLSTSQFLTTFQAGTEATSGSATLTTTNYSVTIE
ncbi:glycoside hydrolase family 12 protein [Lentinula aciculospora]|uniref:Glycoside hydrolase family 12 protein n=1 Tax=Lentinula aciculospora TaxID=153920 RepID=A0A9W9A5G4_9AGAR|nr:glycoside hydrolase family 12 protein [Lentinula aciculospora]